jgi:hypothetical protein
MGLLIFASCYAAIGRAKIEICTGDSVEPSPLPVIGQEVNVYQALQCVASLITDVENAKQLARHHISQLQDELNAANQQRDQALYALQETQDKLKRLVGRW